MIQEVKDILDKYDSLALECDGFSRVAAYILQQHNISYKVYTDTVEWNARILALHYWIVCDSDAEIVDYRLRMWFGLDAPHGIFSVQHDEVNTFENKLLNLKYKGNITRLTINDYYFNILTSLTGQFNASFV